jgi:hypothetical protein
VVSWLHGNDALWGVLVTAHLTVTHSWRADITRITRNWLKRCRKAAVTRALAQAVVQYGWTSTVCCYSLLS